MVYKIYYNVSPGYIGDRCDLFTFIMDTDRILKQNLHLPRSVFLFGAVASHFLCESPPTLRSF